MKKKLIRRTVFCLLLIVALGAAGVWRYGVVPGDREEIDLLATARNILSFEPPQVKILRSQEVPEIEEGRQEYYFSRLNEREQRSYREMLASFRAWESEFYLTVSKDEEIDRVYHAVLNDHPEIFWVRNRRPVYKTLYSGQDYCSFTPSYSYMDENGEKDTQALESIEASMEQAFRNVQAMLGEDASDYEKVSTVYTYLIDHTEYSESEDDQSIAGAFWKNEAVCAGYAGAVQYLLERLGVFCIYVEGASRDSEEGHAWNIARIDGEYYYVDATNGDQPDFLVGDAVSLAEHKTILMDYLCPFPEEYEQTYQASELFELPVCTSKAYNFYLLNNGCFDTYDPAQLNAYFHMRIDGAAVIRFKYSTPEAFFEALQYWAEDEYMAEALQYYMIHYGLSQVQYHYGVLDSLLTVYYIF